MHIILDSDIIIECLRGNATIIAALKKHAHAGALISYTVISPAEIHAGMRAREAKAVGAFFQSIHFLPFDEAIGIKAGEYLQRFAKSHAIEIADALIAAATAVSGGALLTLNKKHYPMRDFEVLLIDTER